MVFFENIDKNVRINSLFLGNSCNFYFCPRKTGDFFISELKKVVCPKQCPLYGFHFRDM